MKSEELCRSLLESAGIPVNSSEPWSIQVHDDRLWDRVVSQQSLGLGEAYIDSWWDCKAMDQMLTKILTAQIEKNFRPSFSILINFARSTVLNRQTQQRAAQNAKHHYNIGNDLYERMLDKEMVYSCAYWEDAKTLEKAQFNKLDLVCQKLDLEPGMRVLDIGHGWGGFLRHAVKHYGVIGVGISPADNQITLAKERSRGMSITFKQMDYRNLEGKFDRIVSIGMMEHVGPKNLNTFFNKCDDLLEKDGVMLHHTIGSTYLKNTTDLFFDRYIFPGGVLPSLTQIFAAAEKKFIIEDVHQFGSDYDRTLMEWHKNINARWSEIPKYDERFKRMWNYYLLASAASFRARNLQLFQVIFRKPGFLPAYQSIR